jgi:hypothetical protein
VTTDAHGVDFSCASEAEILPQKLRSAAIWAGNANTCTTSKQNWSRSFSAFGPSYYAAQSFLLKPILRHLADPAIANHLERLFCANAMDQ